MQCVYFYFIFCSGELKASEAVYLQDCMLNRRKMQEKIKRIVWLRVELTVRLDPLWSDFPKDGSIKSGWLVLGQVDGGGTRMNWWRWRHRLDNSGWPNVFHLDLPVTFITHPGYSAGFVLLLAHFLGRWMRSCCPVGGPFKGACIGHGHPNGCRWLLTVIVAQLHIPAVMTRWLSIDIHSIDIVIIPPYSHFTCNLH